MTEKSNLELLLEEGFSMVGSAYGYDLYTKKDKFILYNKKNDEPLISVYGYLTKYVGESK